MTTTADTGIEGQDKDREGLPPEPDPSTAPPIEPTAPKPNVVEPHDNGQPYPETEEVPVIH